MASAATAKNYDDVIIGTYDYTDESGKKQKVDAVLGDFKLSPTRILRPSIHNEKQESSSSTNKLRKNFHLRRWAAGVLDDAAGIEDEDLSDFIAAITSDLLLGVAEKGGTPQAAFKALFSDKIYKDIKNLNDIDDYPIPSKALTAFKQTRAFQRANWNEKQLSEVAMLVGRFVSAEIVSRAIKLTKAEKDAHADDWRFQLSERHIKKALQQLGIEYDNTEEEEEEEEIEESE
jgi:hypothetical protein